MLLKKRKRIVLIIIAIIAVILSSPPKSFALCTNSFVASAGLSCIIFFMG